MLARVVCANGKEMGTITAGSLVKSPPGYSIHHSVHGGPCKQPAVQSSCSYIHRVDA